MILHGVKANHAHVLNRARLLHEERWNVLVYDARGCGRSGGSVISFGYWETLDLDAALGWLTAHGNRELVAIGISQGAATLLLGADVLAAHGVRAIVAEACYASLDRALDNRTRLYTGLPSHPWADRLTAWAERYVGVPIESISPLACAPRLTCPVLL